MKKALAIPFEFAAAPGILGTLLVLVGEVSFALLLLVTERVPTVLVRALQVFLRF